MHQDSFSGTAKGAMTALAVVMLGIVAYANTVPGEFVWDDVSSVLLHQHVQDTGKFFQLFKEDQHAFGRGQGNFYRPLVAVSFMIDFALSGGSRLERITDLNPVIFHLSSIAWHIGAALLLLALLNRLGAPPFVAAAASIIYVLHPLHTEAVAYISGRADSMSAVFMFAALFFAMTDADGLRRAVAFALSALCFAGGLLSKESSAMFPFLLALFVFLRPAKEGETTRQALIRRSVPLLVSLAMLGIYGWLRSTVLKFGGAASPDITLTRRIIETGQAFAAYIRLLFVPTNLHMERTLEGVPTWTAILGWALVVLLLGLFVAGLWVRGRRISLGIAWFLVTWFPISGLIPLNAPMAEHWLYVPMAGFFLALTECWWKLFENRSHRWPAAIPVYALCLLFLGLTINRNHDWLDNEVLYRATLAKNPNSLRVHYNLAVTYGDLEGNLPGARRHYEAVLRLYEKQRQEFAAQGRANLTWTEEVEAQLSLGDICAEQREYEAALQHYQQVLAAPKSQEFAPLVARASQGMRACLQALGQTGTLDLTRGPA